jgi:hypothetical protein
MIKLLIGLVALLLACMAWGAVRKLRGGTFLPPTGVDGDDHMQDKEGRWWRYEKDNNTFEEVFRRRKKVAGSTHNYSVSSGN